MKGKWISLFVLISVHCLNSAAQSFDDQLDLVLIIDGSGSVQDTHPPLWESQKMLINNLINNLRIGQDYVRVAVIVFSDTASVMWQLDRYDDKSSLLAAIDSLEFIGGLSNIYDALLKSKNEVFGQAGDRTTVRDAVLIFSDGIPTVNVHLTETCGEDLRAAGIKLTSVGIGDFRNDATLRYLSSSPAMSYVLGDIQEGSGLVYNTFLAEIKSELSQEAIDADPCLSDPCKNGGWCSSREDPYGWRFYCYCPFSTFTRSGGRLCQIADPCTASPCPQNAVRCRRSITTDTPGRFCYDSKWRLI